MKKLLLLIVLIGIGISFLDIEVNINLGRNNNEEKKIVSDTENTQVTVYSNTSAGSNIPLVVMGENKESITVFKNTDSDQDSIDTIVISTANQFTSTIKVNSAGYPEKITSSAGTIIYSNYDYENKFVDIILTKSNGEIQEFKKSPIESFQSARQSILFPTAYADDDYYLGTLGQVWSIVSCGSGIGMTIVTGGAASPLLYLSCGVFATRVITSNMEIGSCTGDIIECAKNAVTGAFSHTVIPENIQSKKLDNKPVVLNANPSNNSKRYVSSINYRGRIQGLWTVFSGNLDANFEGEKGTCVLHLDSTATGRPILDVEMPSGVEAPEVNIKSTLTFLECNGKMNPATEIYKLSGELKVNSSVGDQSFSTVELFKIQGNITGDRMRGVLSLESSGLRIDF
ncbi:hypothetical protein COB57_05670 [Candidatus Peregrinibacteria bacterium]|nr:MAG: hypothetical protein COB57_05670 [Candidatus Peregrinibacteria bacterium]